jgi:hypothetical protein
MAANPLMQQFDDAGIHNGNAIVAYAPYGLGREPMFNVRTDLAQARQQPAEDSLDRAGVDRSARAGADAGTDARAGVAGPAAGRPDAGHRRRNDLIPAH